VKKIEILPLNSVFSRVIVIGRPVCDLLIKRSCTTHYVHRVAILAHSYLLTLYNYYYRRFFLLPSSSQHGRRRRCSTLSLRLLPLNVAAIISALRFSHSSVPTTIIVLLISDSQTRKPSGLPAPAAMPNGTDQSPPASFRWHGLKTQICLIDASYTDAFCRLRIGHNHLPRRSFRLALNSSPL